MKVLQEKLQMCNEELSQANEHQRELEKQLKSTEVSYDKIDIIICIYIYIYILLKIMRIL
jgi:hypothetical protein